jgi:hypothetical protein
MAMSPPNVNDIDLFTMVLVIFIFQITIAKLWTYVGYANIDLKPKIGPIPCSTIFDDIFLSKVNTC